MSRSSSADEFLDENVTSPGNADDQPENIPAWSGNISKDRMTAEKWVARVEVKFLKNNIDKQNIGLVTFARSDICAKRHLCEVTVPLLGAT
jgi:hypothetical protein